MREEEFAYTNNFGETVRIGGDSPCWIEGGAVRGFSKPYVLSNGSVPRFYDEAQERSVRLVYDFEEGGKEGLDRLMDVFARDVGALSPGRLESGGWMVRCYLVGMSDDYEESFLDKYVTLDLTLLVIDPLWTKEHKYSFRPTTSGGDGLNYPRNHPYNYSAPSSVGSIDVPSALPSPVSITVYGPADNPVVSIGGNRYEVAASVPSGGILAIDAIDRTITVMTEFGSEVNVFSLRRGVQRSGSGEFIFEPVRPGASVVTWDGSFGFDLTVFERRDERRYA